MKNHDQWPMTYKTYKNGRGNVLIERRAHVPIFKRGKPAVPIGGGAAAPDGDAELDRNRGARREGHSRLRGRAYKQQEDNCAVSLEYFEGPRHLEVEPREAKN